MKGAGSAYARPSSRRKFLPPSRGSRASSSAGANSATMMRSHDSGTDGDSRSNRSSSATRRWFIGSRRRVSTASNNSSLLPKW